MGRPSTGITVRELARLAGVSRQTVSDALRGTGRVAAATQKRIRELAEEFRYAPDPLISAGLAQIRRKSPQRTKAVLGYVETGSTPDLTGIHESYRRLYQGAQERAENLGYLLERFSIADPNIKPKGLQKILFARGIRGLVILYIDDWNKDPAPLPLDLNQFAAATIGARLRTPALHFAMADEFANTQLCIQYLTDLGYQRIGLALPSPLDRLIENRISHAYYGWQQSKSAGVRLPVFDNRVTQFESTANAYRSWIDRWKPDAIMSFPQGRLNRHLGLRFPEQAGFVHLDRNPSNSGIAGIDQKHEATGAAAVDIVARLLALGEIGPPSTAHGTLIEGRWVAGATVEEQGRASK
ncbi:LacI family DNA-binding transcriptional regulator [Cerasicoccus arenae]|nr:LacI family DNA-binding transcriptional regulator [Cerasicoccus arenae]MBK1858350.1 LacI family DNA-binding transcriptional regulator [Cerasicoccus arenae]